MPKTLARGEIIGIFKSEITPSPFLLVAISLISFAMPVIAETPPNIAGRKGSIIINIINEIYMAQVRKSQCN